ncbi:WhiB family transcriptional regulator [Rhodococcus opacus]|uniref:WhiB family transcriptional regulator n=1 Tax=Rhodococcus opacus TaxID=37919 RepID=UPI0002A1F7C1|nr:WhiB family transcriptional regulator [Rhodococcus opacus]ELB88918.1 WhiB family transcriptional regulator [Rhodococcus wratislaviensis IFP 2016]MDX5962641.1 WhiB family transcriptional regulator [Rhodococcus opacus]
MNWWPDRTDPVHHIPEPDIQIGGFPDPSESFDYAAKVCDRCPIAGACGAFAVGTAQSGVWGGRECRRGTLIR